MGQLYPYRCEGESMDDLLTSTVNSRRLVSASMKVRKRWAWHEAFWISWRLVANLIPFGLFSLFIPFSGNPVGIFFGVFFFVLALFILANTVKRILRVRLIMRGRGWPLAERLVTEMGDLKALMGFSAVILVLTLIVTSSGEEVFYATPEMKAENSLSAIRLALRVYSQENPGTYPQTLKPLLKEGKYLAFLPKANLRRQWHENSRKVELGVEPIDNGGWLYNNNPSDPNYGTIRINCTHTDKAGKRWSSY